MLLDLKGKVGIVTGGGRGIGRTIAETLVAEGVTTFVVDNREDLLATWTGPKIVADVRQAEDCRRVAAEIERLHGRIDILVNNAGVAASVPVETMSEEVWDANFDANIKGVFLMSQAVVPVMKRQRAGRIISASSFAAIIPSLGGAAYGASKAGVENFSRVLAGELGPYGITVNAYAPGMVPTEMNHFADAPDERKGHLLDTLTLRRWGEPQDVANLIVFLASDQAGYITGTLIDVSGGKFATQMPWLAHR
jgi:3-oxoacyl-[acyl-carrier protein] reductase